MEPKETASLVAEVMKQLLPVITEATKANQLTPQILNEMKKPYVDPVKEKQQLAHRRRTQKETADSLLKKQQTQDACSHVHINAQGVRSEALNLMWGRPGGTWAICPKCKGFVHAGHWEIDYNPDDPNGTPRWVDEHKDYDRVRALCDAVLASNNNYAA